jgi:hypothetical protein
MSTETQTLTPEQLGALDIARDMISIGIPIFTAQPTTLNKLGFLLPDKWEQTRPNKYHVDHWRPGMALCAVGGVVVDFIDVDPRNGGDDGVASAEAAGRSSMARSPSSTQPPATTASSLTPPIATP